MTRQVQSLTAKKNKNSVFWTNVKRDWRLYVLLLIPMMYFIVFKYIPMLGIAVAFKDYNIFQGVIKSPWIGLRNFERLFAMDDFRRVLFNTIRINVLELFFSFPMPIILSLCLNEIISVRFKKFAQTALYLPYFLSWAVVGGIMYQLFSTNTGMVNVMLGTTVPFLTNKHLWLIIYLISGIWQTAGWNTIIYLAAITGIDPALYEAAEVDGAGTFRKIINITLPSIKPTIVMLLIMKLGSMVSIGFERPFVMGNTLVKEYSDVLSTFVYRLGLQGGKFSFATAAGVFQSVVSVLLLVIANVSAKAMGEKGIW